MLEHFVAEHRDEIGRRCRVKAELRAAPAPLPAAVDSGVPLFLDQLVDALCHHQSAAVRIATSAARHGRDLHRQGVTISQVVHDYGDVCQSITDLAVEQQAPISVEEFRTLNRCLDDAIAAAVTEFGRGDQALMAAAAFQDAERLGFLAHEIRNLVGTASMAFQVLKTGSVAIGGSTGGVLERSLAALRATVHGSIDEVRLRHGTSTRSHFPLGPFIGELVPAATLEADGRGLSFRAESSDGDALIHADRAVLAAVLANLLQNAFKFTRPGSCVTLRSSATAERVVIAVEDECGGLAEGNLDGLFTSFEQRGADRTGLGLGLAMCRWGTEVNGGRISVRNHAPAGCVFTVDLPRA